jgi:hypothetical protein
MRHRQKTNAMSTPAKPTFVPLFKPVRGGFVYRAPNGWLIGGATRYFVTEPQKDEITAASQPPSLAAMFRWLILMVPVVLLVLGAAIALIWYRHSYQVNGLTFGDNAIILVAALLPMLLASQIAVRSQMNRLRPLLATLPKSDVKITRDDRQRALMDLYSAKQLWLQAAMGAFGAAVILALVCLQFWYAQGALSPLSILSLVTACLVGGGAIIRVRLAQRKAKQEPAAC